MSDQESGKDQGINPFEEAIRVVSALYISDGARQAGGETPDQRDARWRQVMEEHDQYAGMIQVLKDVASRSFLARAANPQQIIENIEMAFSDTHRSAEYFLTNLVLARLSMPNGVLARTMEDGGVGIGIVEETERIKSQVHALPGMDSPERLSQFTARDAIGAVLGGEITVQPPLIPS